MDADRCAIGVSLSESLPRRRFYHADDIRVSSCCTRPELCRDGDLYVATISADRDGHEDAALAAARGACGILCERLLPIALPQCVVPHTNEALATLCQHLAGNPGRKLAVTGVAGLRGLTTSQLLLESVLQRGGYRSAGFNYLSYNDGFESIPRISENTTAAQHAQWLANSLANGCSHAVMELPRDEVASRTYDATPLDSLMLTEFTTASHRKTPSPKTGIYFDRALRRLDEDGLLIANVDCPVVRQLLETVEHPALTVSLGGEPADVTAKVVERCPSEQTFLLSAASDCAVVRTKVIGDAHVRMCLLAAATSLGMGIELPNIVSGIESIESVPGRMERVECGQPFSVFSDGAATCYDLHRALSSLREITSGRLICLLGQGASREVELRFRRGRIAEKLADQSVITSDDWLDTQPLRATHDLLDGFQKPARAHVMPNRIRAIEWALSECRPGDTLLLAGPHNHGRPYMENCFPPDADVARLWLYGLAESDYDSILPRG